MINQFVWRQDIVFDVFEEANIGIDCDKRNNFNTEKSNRHNRIEFYLNV